MKRTRLLLCVLIVAVLLAMLTGCYMISGQRMNKLKGTYKLTNYTYTPRYSDKDGRVPATRNYITDEKYLYEDYLIITSGSTGYYVHKAVGVPAYVKEVRLSFTYSEEDSSKIEYVTYVDVLTQGQQVDGSKLGVSGNTLNFSAPSLHVFSEHTRDISVSWQKVDNATDLSYVKGQLGELKEYDYNAFGVRGIYEWNLSTELATGAVVESQYQYFYYVVDTAKGVTTAKVYYALKETPTEQVEKTVPFSGSADWSTLTIDGAVWTREGSCYYSESDGLKRQISCISSDISDSNLQWYIESRLPVVAE